MDNVLFEDLKKVDWTDASEVRSKLGGNTYSRLHVGYLSTDFPKFNALTSELLVEIAGTQLKEIALQSMYFETVEDFCKTVSELLVNNPEIHSFSLQVDAITRFGRVQPFYPDFLFDLITFGMRERKDTLATVTVQGNLEKSHIDKLYEDGLQHLTTLKTLSISINKDEPQDWTLLHPHLATVLDKGLRILFLSGVVRFDSGDFDKITRRMSGDCDLFSLSLSQHSVSHPTTSVSESLSLFLTKCPSLQNLSLRRLALLGDRSAKLAQALRKLPASYLDISNFTDDVTLKNILWAVRKSRTLKEAAIVFDSFGENVGTEMSKLGKSKTLERLDLKVRPTGLSRESADAYPLAFGFIMSEIVNDTTSIKYLAYDSKVRFSLCPMEDAFKKNTSLKLVLTGAPFDIRQLVKLDKSRVNINMNDYRTIPAGPQRRLLEDWERDEARSDAQILAALRISNGNIFAAARFLTEDGNDL